MVSHQPPCNNFFQHFAQNMYLPNFAAEQPGATYCYSPLNAYPFGIVDCSTQPSQLTAMMFYEGTIHLLLVELRTPRGCTIQRLTFTCSQLKGEAKKRGNTVASLIWKFLEVQGLRNGSTANEINLVFDNCAGQNKNRMVTRFLFYLVKLKICQTARAIFLVKGHTKNNCD
jgi:hypothetical protein